MNTILSGFLKVAERVGVPTALCAVLCIAIWFSVKWTAEEVVKPVISSHLKYLETEKDDRKEMKTALLKQTDILEDIRNDQRKFPAVAEKM